MATSTAGTFLMYKATPEALTFEKLVDIVDFPDLGSAPSKLDTTTLSATTMKTTILGLQEAPDLTFTANYTKADFDKINALTGEYKFELQFGTEGADGKFDWDGEIKVFATGGGVDEVRKMTIVISASTPIVPAV